MNIVNYVTVNHPTPESVMKEIFKLYKVENQCSRVFAPIRQIGSKYITIYYSLHSGEYVFMILEGNVYFILRETLKYVLGNIHIDADRIVKMAMPNPLYIPASLQLKINSLP